MRKAKPSDFFCCQAVKMKERIRNWWRKTDLVAFNSDDGIYYRNVSNGETVVEFALSAVLIAVLLFGLSFAM